MVLKKKIDLINEKIFKISAKIFPYLSQRTLFIDDQLVAPAKSEIPNIVYQTWVSKSIPRRLGKEIKKFRKLNKDFSFKIFSDEERDKYMKDFWSDNEIYNIYLRAIFEPCKADIFRYCIIYERGGFYFDIKSGCDLPLSQLKPSNGAIISHEASNTIIPPNKDYINTTEYPFNLIENWSFAFKPKHPFLKLLIETIVEFAPSIKGKIFQNPKNGILAFTGPGMMTKVFQIYNSGVGDYITPNGIDLNGAGRYSLGGADLRFKFSSSYTNIKNSKIIK